MAKAIRDGKRKNPCGRVRRRPRIANERIGSAARLTTLSAQGVRRLFQVTLLCGLILASPIIFYQFWAFVGAGLYPHEGLRLQVLPFSVGCSGGVFLCFIWVLPGAVKALLAFNDGSASIPTSLERMAQPGHHPAAGVRHRFKRRSHAHSLPHRHVHRKIT
jgi:hypothetical protein